MELNENMIVSYFRDLEFSDAFRLLQCVANCVNENESHKRNMEMIGVNHDYTNMQHNPYEIEINLSNIHDNVNFFGELFKENNAEKDYVNSLDWHTRLQYEKFNK